MNRPGFVGVALCLALVAVVVGQGLAQGSQPGQIVAQQVPLGSAFTYQGQLTLNGSPVSGSCDFQFGLFDAATSGTQIGTTVTQASVSVANGVFAAAVDFGSNAFTGDARWIEVAVRCPAGSGSYTALSPRQPLTPVPYALFAAAAGGAGGGSGWALAGNAGTSPATSFLGTTDNVAFEVRVNNARALRLEPNATSPNVIAGFGGNVVTATVVGATISGGGADASTNRVTDNYGTVGGGRNNQAGDGAGTVTDRSDATVGGGASNTASGRMATVGGGDSNTASGIYATVAGGLGSVVSGGAATVGGGAGNTASNNASTVAGGQGNTASGGETTVAGGMGNTASGGSATVAGGWNNTASGDYSFAAGRRAKANHAGAFVWADSTDADFASTAANEFAVRAAGGVNMAVASGGLRIEPNATSPNVIEGYTGNGVSAQVVGATIGGGGQSVLTNRVTDDYGTVGGGAGNRAGDDAGTAADNAYATVGGGGNNTASGSTATVGGGGGNTASGALATVGGGFFNTASRMYATVGGGYTNTASGIAATVGGGESNAASGFRATIGGGTSNTASGDYAIVGGGNSNTASGSTATVAGGGSNTASGFVATVGGGTFNTASGNYSFAAGRRAKANHDGAFVWADSNAADFASTAIDEFNVRAGGGTRIFSDSGATIGVQLAAGGNAWSALSDRNLKENVRPLDGRDILHRLSQVPISEWNLKGQDPAIRHIGPMAQDFAAAFGVGEDDRHISTVDADGVALAAIQGLYQLVQEQDAQIAAQQQQIAALETRLAKLEALLAR